MNVDIEGNYLISACSNALTTMHKFDVKTNDEESNFINIIGREFVDCLMKRGKFSRTTGLRNLKFSTESLKHYSELLTAAVNNEDTENSSNVKYEVNIKILNPEIQTPASIKIMIYRSSDDNDEILVGKSIVYVGLFFSWKETYKKHTAEFINLPFFFEYGSQKLVSLMKTLLSSYFDTRIIPIILNPLEMKWILGITLESIESPPCDQVKFVYKFVEEDSKIEFMFSFKELRILWKNLHNGSETEIKNEEVLRFYTALTAHVTETTMIDLNYFTLKHFSIPGCMTLDSSGKICISKKHLLDTFIRFLSSRIVT